MFSSVAHLFLAILEGLLLLLFNYSHLLQRRLVVNLSTAETTSETVHLQVRFPFTCTMFNK